jgi:hypothetical protein
MADVIEILGDDIRLHETRNKKTGIALADKLAAEHAASGNRVWCVRVMCGPELAYETKNSSVRK